MKELLINRVWYVIFTDVICTFLNNLRLLSFVLLVMACRPARVVVSHAANIPVDSLLADDQASTGFLKPWKDSLGGFISIVVGRTDTAFYPARPSGNLDNLCADLMLRYGDSAGRALNGLPVHFALLNNGGLRNPLPSGEIRLGDLFELMPFENEAVLLKINGQAADSLFRHIIRRGGEPVAGLKLEVDEKQAYRALIGGEPFDSRRDYWLVTSDYLAQGGDGFFMLRNAMQRIALKCTVRDVLRQGIQSETRQYGVVRRRNENRIIYVNAAGVPQK